jgi:hypothetical protein
VPAIFSRFLGLAALAAIAPLCMAQAQVDRMSQMQGIAQSLGVQCSFCHSAQRGSGAPEPKKDIARVMLKMTEDINARIHDATGKTAAEGAVTVDCATCHHGITVPKPLNQIMLETVFSKGSADAIARYKELRGLYYGRAAYDFGEDTIISVSQVLAQSRPADAIALLNMNLEYFPKSSKTYVAKAFAQTRKLDDAGAIASLETALEIDPENGTIRGRLEQLKSYRRK